jgi:hypothetical protein
MLATPCPVRSRLICTLILTKSNQATLHQPRTEHFVSVLKGQEGDDRGTSCSRWLAGLVGFGNAWAASGSPTRARSPKPREDASCRSARRL